MIASGGSGWASSSTPRCSPPSRSWPSPIGSPTRSPSGTATSSTGSTSTLHIPTTPRCGSRRSTSSRTSSPKGQAYEHDSAAGTELQGRTPEQGPDVGADGSRLPLQDGEADRHRGRPDPVHHLGRLQRGAVLRRLTCRGGRVTPPPPTLRPDVLHRRGPDRADAR